MCGRPAARGLMEELPAGRNRQRVGTLSTGRKMVIECCDPRAVSVLTNRKADFPFLGGQFNTGGKTVNAVFGAYDISK